MPHKPEIYRDVSEGPESSSTDDIHADYLIVSVGVAGLTTDLCPSRFLGEWWSRREAKSR